jgi:flavodoxin
LQNELFLYYIVIGVSVGVNLVKTLIVYFSRSGVTRKVAEKISVNLGADLEEITEKNKRNGIFGFLKSGMEAYLERLVTIDQPKHDASQYDVVAIGTPVWAGKMSSPVRSYIANNKDKLKSVAFFATHGGQDAQKALVGLEKYVGKKALSSVSIRSGEVEKETCVSKVEDFLTNLK